MDKPITTFAELVDFEAAVDWAWATLEITTEERDVAKEKARAEYFEGHDRV